MITFHVMQDDERQGCVELAVRAFSDYEYFSVYVPKKRTRIRFLKALLSSEFKANKGRAHFLTVKQDEKTVAVLMLCAPDYQKPSDKEYLKAGYGKVFLHGGIGNVSAWNKMEEEAIKPCRALTGKVWYLNLITIDPDFEGIGIGSRTMQDFIIPYVRENGGEKLCLFTNSEINRKFYRKNGFDEFHEQFFTYKGHRFGSWSFQKTFN